MPTPNKKISSVITSSTSYEPRLDCNPSCPSGSSCWGTSSGSIKFCITNGKDPNKGALPGDMMMTEEISRGGIMESFTNTGQQMGSNPVQWQGNERFTPLGMCFWGCEKAGGSNINAINACKENCRVLDNEREKNNLERFRQYGF